MSRSGLLRCSALSGNLQRRSTPRLTRVHLKSDGAAATHGAELGPSRRAEEDGIGLCKVAVEAEDRAKAMEAHVDVLVCQACHDQTGTGNYEEG
jgi:hypothetical protein